jgi:GGDEF domain-containing protein
LLAFPDFHLEFPYAMAESLRAGALVGVAIGDVDNLKDYVENSNVADTELFGHLAGNAVMSRLGDVARAWFWDQDVVRGCVSTFGGDEIIVALETAGEGAFVAAVTELRARLNGALPRTVSFALTTLSMDGPTAFAGNGPHDAVYMQTMRTLDGRLFECKAAHRRAGHAVDSFIVMVDMSASARAGVAG